MPAVSLMVDSKADSMETPASPSSQIKGEKSAAFATPDRDPELPQAPNTRAKTEEQKTGTSSAGKSNTVTPPESGTREDAKKSETDELPSQSSKQVRFDGANDKAKPENDVAQDTASPLATDSPASSTSSASKRGFVSRRGGRYGSPNRALPPNAQPGPVLEYKTYRSPARKSDNDTIPSLTSASSGGLQSTSSPNAGDPGRPLNKSSGDKGVASDGPAPEQKGALKNDVGGEAKAVSDASRQTKAQSGSSSAGVAAVKKGKPTSITCDPSMIHSTSPLASHDVDGSPSGGAAQRKPVDAPSAATSKAASRKPEGEGGTETRRNVTFSPPQPPRDAVFDKPRKTPTKSPGGHFQSLPSLQDAKLQSPCGIFLSPYSPSPSAYQTIAEVPSFDRPAAPASKQTEEAGATRPFPDEKSSKARDQERERTVSTPTDFALDFGKGHELSASFDASNVLAWLQSPTAHGLFSPGGGFGSTANTPRGRYPQPRTPRTPTVGTSFFFSDVASLPRNGEFTSPKPQGASDAGGGPKRGGQQGPLSNMICISPLASSKRAAQGGSLHAQGGAQADMQIQYKDVFASPRLPMPQAAGGKPRNMPLVGESSKGSKPRGRSNLDTVHMAERDLMEDDDLSVLLQLASHSNPGQAGGSGPHVFRSSPRTRANGQVQGGYGAAPGGTLPGLQLPIIGGHGGDGAKAKLSRKTAFREHADANDFTPPPLALRSSSSGGSKEIYLGGAEAGKGGTKNDGSGKVGKSKAKSKNGHAADTGKRNPGATGASKAGAKKAGKKGSTATTYTMPGAQMPYPHPGDPSVQYYPMHGAMPALPPGGNMRVVVGGPPPANAGSPSRPDKYTSSPHHPYGMQSGHGQPPPHGSYAHHPYSHPPPPHMGGMAVPTPYGHYPPHPHHMPMYATQHPQGAAKGASKKTKSKGPKAAKRSTDGKATTPISKKQKKSPSKSGAKRKQKTPGTTSGPVDRQKAAAAIAAVNQASGGKNDKAAALAAAILRGVTMRPSGKWQAQLYYAGKSRYIGVFDTREKAALAYEIAREKLKADKKSPADQSAQSLKATEAAVNCARKAAFEGVNEKDPRLPSK